MLRLESVSLSPCKKDRYSILYQINEIDDGPSALAIMTNPSIAGRDQPHDRAVRTLSQMLRSRFSWLEIVNLYPRICSESVRLGDDREFCAENFQYVEDGIANVINKAIICGWGVDKVDFAFARRHLHPLLAGAESRGKALLCFSARGLPYHPSPRGPNPNLTSELHPFKPEWFCWRTPTKP